MKGFEIFFNHWGHEPLQAIENQHVTPEYLYQHFKARFLAEVRESLVDAVTEGAPDDSA